MFELPEPTLKYLSIEPTNHCNLSCKVCWSQNPHLRVARPKGYMKLEQYQQIIEELQHDYNCEEITASLSFAGESLLHKQFKQFAEIFSTVPFKKRQIATNGTLLTKEICVLLAECFTEIAVSLHQTRYLPKVLMDSQTLYNECKKTGCTLRHNVIIQEFTRRESGKLRRVTMNHRDGFKVFGAISEDMHPSPGMQYPQCRGCPMHFFYLAVLWNGETLPCCHLLSPGMFSLGNVFKSSIREVLDASLIKRLRSQNWVGTPCEGCNIYT